MSGGRARGRGGVESFDEGTLEFGSPLGFGDADEVFRVARRKWRLVLCSAATAGEKITSGEGDGAFELYDPLPDFKETGADWLILVGPYGQSGYELPPPPNAVMAVRTGGRDMGVVEFVREVACPYDLGMYVYAGNGTAPNIGIE